MDTVWTCRLRPNSYNSSAQVNLETEEGDYISVGTTLVFGELATGQGHISKVSNDGELLWNRVYRYVEFGDNLLFDVDQMPGGGYLCTGWLNGIPGLGDSIPDQDVWLLAVDEMGCLVPGCDTLTYVLNQENSIAFSIYPNPTRDFINVAFGMLSFSQGARIELYDLQGRKLKETPITHLQATYVFSTDDLPAGQYLIRVISGEAVETKRVVVQ